MSSTPTKPRQMRELPLLVNIVSQLSSQYASPHNSDASPDNFGFQRFSSFLAKDEVEKFIKEVSTNIKEGKYHRAMIRMQRLFTRNQHSMMSDSEQISIYRRYFECLRRLSKRYFSQAQLSKQQTSNMQKMCERGMYLIRSWNLIITELLEQKNEIAAYVPPSQPSIIMSQQLIERSPTRKGTSFFKAEAERQSKSPLLSPKASSPSRYQIQKQQETLKRQVLLQNIDFHINEFLKAHFLLLHSWAQLYKKQEDIELYTLMLFKSVELAEKLDKTQEEELVDNFAKVYIEIGNFYLSSGQIKESIKNLETALDYLHRAIKLRGGNEKLQKLKKMSTKRKKQKQQQVLQNLLLIVCVLYDLSIAEEIQNNYSRVLESLSIAEWLSNIFLTQSYPELDKTVSEALETAKGKYKDIVHEEGEIYAIMDEALGFRYERMKKKEEDKVEDNDFYSYYSKILYDKFNVSEINQSLYITIPKRHSQMQVSTPPSPTLSDTPSSRATQPHARQQISSLSPRFLLSQKGSPSYSPNNKAASKIGSQSCTSKQQAHRLSFLKPSAVQVFDKQPSVQENLSSYKVQSQSRITKATSKNGSYSVDRTPRLYAGQNQSSFFNNTTLGGFGGNTPQTSYATRTPQQSTFASRTHSLHSFTKSYSKPTILIGEAEEKIIQNDYEIGLISSSNIQSRNASPSQRQQQRPLNNHNQSIMSNLANSTVLSNRISKSNKRKEQPLVHVQKPKILTTDKYFDDSKAVFYSELHDDQFFGGVTKKAQERIKNKEKEEQKSNQNQENPGQTQKEQKAPIVVQTLDEFFEERLNNELNSHNRQNNSSNIKYQEVVSGVSFIMKDEQFDKEEFGQAAKLLKFKVGSDQLFSSFRKTEIRGEPKQSKAQTQNEFQLQINDQESQQSLKLLLSNAKAYKKEFENQRMAKNLIQNDFEVPNERTSLQSLLTKKLQNNLKNARNSIARRASISESTPYKGRSSFQRNSIEQNQSLDPRQQAKKQINLEIEHIDSQLKSEEREMQELKLPKDRRPGSQNDSIVKLVKQEIKDDHGKSPKGLVLGIQPHKQIISNHNLKFLDDYKLMAESTRVISQKKDAKKGLTFADVVISAYSAINQQSFSSINQSAASSISTRLLAKNDQRQGQNKKASPSKNQSSLTISLRKLMRLKTSDLEDPANETIPPKIRPHKESEVATSKE